MGKDSRKRREGKPLSPEEQDRAWTNFSRAFKRDVLPRLLSSAINLVVYDGDDEAGDIKFAAELGVMLMLGKPLILMVGPDVVVPPGLARAADEIVEIDAGMGIASQDRAAAAVQRVAAQLDQDDD